MRTCVMLWGSFLVWTVILVSHTEVVSATPEGLYTWDEQTKEWVWSEGEKEVEEEGSGNSYDNEGDAEDDDYDNYGSGYDDTYDDYENTGTEYNSNTYGYDNQNSYNSNTRDFDPINSVEKNLENEVFGHSNNNDYTNKQDSYPGQNSVEISEGPAIGNQPDRYPETGNNNPYQPSHDGKGPDSKGRHKTTFFAKTSALAAAIGGAVVGLLCAILCVMLIVYRMRKKDEGSYALNEPKRSPTVNAYTKAPTREFYA